MYKKYLGVALIALLAACKQEDDNVVVPQNGEANFAYFASLGNGITAGYADGTLYKSAQEHSLSALLAEKFSHAGGGEFKQPLVPGEFGWPEAKIRYMDETNCAGNSIKALVPNEGTSDTVGSSNNISVQGPFNAMGFASLRIVDITDAQYASKDPVFARLVRNSSETPLQAFLRNNITFFSIELGSRDVWGYALAGGEGAVRGTQTNDLTGEAEFENAYKILADSLKHRQAKGVLVNIPEIDNLPYFTTIPFNALQLDASSAANLTAHYSARGWQFNDGSNAFVIEDERAEASFRRIKSNELVLMSLPLDSVLCAGWGSYKPIPKQYILDEEELNNIRTFTHKYNDIIRKIAKNNDWALADVNLLLKQHNDGVQFNVSKFMFEFSTNAIFSYDGIHLTEEGNKLYTNEVIRVINNTYKSTLGYYNL